MISIIVNLNTQDYDEIQRLAESIESQTNPNFEVIVVDKNEPDYNLAEYFSRLNYTYINCYDVPSLNNGTIKDMGLVYSKYDYVWFINANDWIKQDAINFLIKNFKRFKNIDFIYFNYDNVGRFTNPNSLYPIDNVVKMKKINKLARLKNFKEFFQEKNIRDFRVCFRKEFLKKNNIRHHPAIDSYDDIYYSLIYTHYFNNALFTTKSLYFYSKYNANYQDYDEQYKSLYAAYMELIHKKKNEDFFWYMLSNYLPILYKYKFSGISERNKMYKQYIGKYKSRSLKSLGHFKKWFSLNLTAYIWIIFGITF